MERREWRESNKRNIMIRMIKALSSHRPPFPSYSCCHPVTLIFTSFQLSSLLSFSVVGFFYLISPPLLISVCSLGYSIAHLSSYSHHHYHNYHDHYYHHHYHLPHNLFLPSLYRLLTTTPIVIWQLFQPFLPIPSSKSPPSSLPSFTPSPQSSPASATIVIISTFHNQ